MNKVEYSSNFLLQQYEHHRFHRLPRLHRWHCPLRLQFLRQEGFVEGFHYRRQEHPWLGGWHEHLLDLRQFHQLSGQPWKVVRWRLESLRLRSFHTHCLLLRCQVLCAILPYWRFGECLFLPRRPLRSLGALLCFGLLSAHPDSPYGIDPVPAGYADEYPDGLGPAYGDHHHVDSHHRLFDARWHEGSNLDRSHPGIYPHRWCLDLPWCSALLNARRTYADVPHRFQYVG